MLAPYEGEHSATVYGPACPQQGSSTKRGTVASSEDCLTLNVFTPAVMLPGSKLPVVVTGSSRLGFGNNTVSRSLHMHEPVIYVSLNYWWFVSVLHSLSESDVSQFERLRIPGEPRSQAYWHWKLEPPRSTTCTPLGTKVYRSIRR